MTLWELMAECDIDYTCPEKIGKLEIRNGYKLCPLYVKRYFLDPNDFENDALDILNNLNHLCIEEVKPYLYFEDNNGFPKLKCTFDLED